MPEPDRLIAPSLDGGSTEGDVEIGGRVSFEPLGEERTAVTLRIDVPPDGAPEPENEARSA